LSEIIFVSKELNGEGRVAASPETVKKYIDIGYSVFIEKGAGLASSMLDSSYKEAGAEIVDSDAVEDADVIIKVLRPKEYEAATYKKGAVVLAMFSPYSAEDEIFALAEREITGFALELLPRITRAQTMDVLSSQANLAGYKAVIDAVGVYSRAIPMLVTAAGTIPAAKVFVMGAGVAGLQAIATARRLGAVVTANDVRPSVREQVLSLGGKFIAVEDEEFYGAETAEGYAKEMSDEYLKKQEFLVADHISKQDIVITTALVPGRMPPCLVTRKMLQTMRPGAIVVDLAVEHGGNVEGGVYGELVDIEGVKVIGYTNLSRIAATASYLYARNLYAFLESMTDKKLKKLAINFNDELVKATLLIHGGRVVHPVFSLQS
jgi:NAD(P) transhydrogenase subunit alpha